MVGILYAMGAVFARLTAERAVRKWLAADLERVSAEAELNQLANFKTDGDPVAAVRRQRALIVEADRMDAAVSRADRWGDRAEKTAARYEKLTDNGRVKIGSYLTGKLETLLVVVLTMLLAPETIMRVREWLVSLLAGCGVHIG